MKYTLKVFKNAKRWLSVFWNCRVWSNHKWTSAHEKGILPTKKQIQDGVVGFADYATMYCDRCGHVSELSTKFKQQVCKPLELN